MSVPQNITKKHLLQAIEQIDKFGVPKNAHSSTYDVVWEGKRYPPKLVVSYANKFANGVELNRDTFQGGEGTPAFKLIRSKGLFIEPKKSKSMQFEKSEIPAFYCVGFHYYSTEKTNQLPRFISEGVWENGYNDKFIDKVKSVKVGSAIVAKTSYTMKKNGKTIPVLEAHARGIVTGNRGDGIILDVEWEKDFERKKFIGQGGYRNTISRVWNNGVIDKLFLDNPTEIALETSNYETLKPSNTILFGPPGTGKTYATKELAVSIARPDFEFDVSSNLSHREQLNKVYEELVQSRQIMFSTFHQSLSYEDFVEGIKPETNEKEEITYKVKSGIFKELCELAETGDGNNIDEAIAKFIAKIDADGEQILETSRGNKFTVTYNGGTTFRINPENSAHENPDYPASIDNIKKLNIGKDVKGMYNPSYVKSILKHLRDKYGLKKGSLNKANKKNHVLIIDEINRGNVSSIFGELITLLEPDKRRGQKEALEVTLPYSKEPFQVPSNIHIIGTMNTADRSVEALDTALRRRFSFSEVMPNPALLSSQYAYWDLLWDYQDKAWNNKEYETKEKSLFEFTGVDDLLVEKRKEIWGKMKDEGRNESQIEYFSEFTFSGIKLDVILKTINTRIEALLDREHTIGHSYFFEVYNSSDKYLKLEEVFRDKIIPLLQEYFFGDYSKIGLVLGDEFIDVEKVEFNKIFAYNTKFEPVDLGTKYSLKPFDDVDFDSALQSLMGYAED